jgi:hypothetical protein
MTLDDLSNYPYTLIKVNLIILGKLIRSNSKKRDIWCK